MMPSISAIPDRIDRAISWESGLPSTSGEESRFVAISMPPSGLRISCATPAAISPSDASFSRWIRRRCVSTCSVRSRSTPTVPIRCPRASKMPVMARWAGKSRPWLVRPSTWPLQPRPPSTAAAIAPGSGR